MSGKRNSKGIDYPGIMTTVSQRLIMKKVSGVGRNGLGGPICNVYAYKRTQDLDEEMRSYQAKELTGCDDLRFLPNESLDDPAVCSLTCAEACMSSLRKELRELAAIA
jgi:hypothetical protein